MKDEYVYVDGKPYRRGYTTGSCATAAAKAAATMIMLNKTIDYIGIDTPKGIPLTLKVLDAKFEDEYAICAIQKDGGDDIDATHGMHIYAKVKLDDTHVIKIDGGEGIGRITKKGLNLPIGAAAINKTPLQMIEKEVRAAIGENKGAEVIIFAPEGQVIAEKTFNPRLGIVGGISIIGTTGIVEPMSDEGWKRSLSIELEMKRAQGLEQIILVPGNHGENYVRDVLKKDAKYVVRMSNFVGYMLLECKRLGYKKILIAGHLGKLIKVAAGIFHTHSKMADARSEVMVANLALMGVPLSLLEEINECTTTEAAIEIIEREDLKQVYSVLANKCKNRCEQYIKDESIQVEVILFSMAGEELASSEGTKEIVEAYQ